jgi:hypothetical protein
MLSWLNDPSYRNAMTVGSMAGERNGVGGWRATVSFQSFENVFTKWRWRGEFFIRKEDGKVDSTSYVMCAM